MPVPDTVSNQSGLNPLVRQHVCLQLLWGFCDYEPAHMDCRVTAYNTFPYMAADQAQQDVYYCTRALAY